MTKASAQPEVIAAMDAAISTLSELGAIVERVDLPDYPAIEVAAAAIIQREALDPSVVYNFAYVCKI